MRKWWKWGFTFECVQLNNSFWFIHWFVWLHRKEQMSWMNDSNTDSLNESNESWSWPYWFSEQVRSEFWSWTKDLLNETLNKRKENFDWKFDWFKYWLKKRILVLIKSQSWMKRFTESDTDWLNERAVNLGLDQMTSWFIPLICWMTEERILALIEMIHWFKHWFAEEEWNESQSWWKDSLTQTLTQCERQKWITTLIERIHWFKHWFAEWERSKSVLTDSLKFYMQILRLKETLKCILLALHFAVAEGPVCEAESCISVFIFYTHLNKTWYVSETIP